MKLFALLFIFFLCSCQLTHAGEVSKMISQETARQIADQRAIAHAFDLSQMNVQVINKTEQWDKTISTFQLYNPKKAVQDASEREYYVIVYQPKQQKPGFITLGGEYYVFVDKHSGEVLLEFAGK